ncbi:ArdC family protein [Methylocapsa palsarum]|uniref:Antirestriction protein ArdC n=1 Tax=Methylocapsa palsarum TaxID=1612308 RepID=A0A1I4CIR9_9HYPH|nr:zincin-like metallopeptidase domain-containing protein [Methylocapsa palsarum]SFK81134.1 Antirestriction protein ArdC [Methylocapsa palsarum]
MKTFKSKTTDGRRDHYQELTDTVVAALEAGTAPWRRPWDPDKSAGSATPVNAATGRRYRGVNTLVLGMSSLAFVSGDPRWCSYRQASERGWQVRKGEKGATIYFYKPLEVKDSSAPAGEDVLKIVPLLRIFTVFHASQIDGVPEFITPNAPKPLQKRIEDADLIMKASGVTLRTGGDRAFYSPATDHIQLPPDASFHSPEDWAVTALHELSHASGAAHRLNRDLTGRFGSSAYSREELRAEISSMYVGSEIGIPTAIPNHASYIQSWIKILKEDKREILRAAADAQKIADYILSFHPHYALAQPDQIGAADDRSDGSPADEALAA